VAIWFVCARRSEKLAREYLNPMVFTLAILFDSTSIAIWCDCRPETPENKDFNMINPFFCKDRLPIAALPSSHKKQSLFQLLAIHYQKY
jgi:hypothetical protein